MPLTELEKDTRTPDLTSQITVQDYTPSSTLNILCQCFIEFTGLDATGGNFELTITVGGATLQPNPQIINFSAVANSSIFTLPFMVPANMEVVIKVKSPNAGDSAGVTTDSYLYDVYDQTDIAAILLDTGTTLDKKLNNLFALLW